MVHCAPAFLPVAQTFTTPVHSSVDQNNISGRGGGPYKTFPVETSKRAFVTTGFEPLVLLCNNKPDKRVRAFLPVSVILAASVRNQDRGIFSRSGSES